MEDNNQEEKQNYLRENILEKGYDTNKFVEFLKSKKGEEGADVTNWNMEDLKKVVKEFISSENNKEKNDLNDSNQNNPNFDESKPIHVPRTSSRSNSRKNSEYFGIKDEEYGIEIEDYIDCKKADESDFSKYDKIHIEIKSYKKNETGMFSKNYFTFLIETSPLDLKANRRYSDFEWLKERLSIIYNTSILPRLSKKGKIVEERKIKRRMRDLEKFLNFLLKDPLIRNSKILFDFLSLESEEEFHKAKKIYDKFKIPHELRDFKSTTGKMKIILNSEKEKYIGHIKDNAELNDSVLKKLDDNFKSLKEDMANVFSRILSFCPIFDKLIKISTKYCDDNAIIESYKQIKHLFESWAINIKRQNSFFFIDVKEYFKFLGGNYRYIKDLVQVVESHKNNYYKNSKSLICKKIELYRRQDTSKWELDIADRNNLVNFYNKMEVAYKKICFKETKNVIKMKEKYGYYVNRMISEYERMRNINAFEIKENTVAYSKKEQKIFSDYINIMGEIVGIIDGCIVEKYKDNEIEAPQFIDPNIDLSENNDYNSQQKEIYNNNNYEEN